MEWLNYNHLHYFWHVAREGSLSRAARRLRLSHSTVSAQIRALEASLGEALFERSGRRLVLTAFGEEVFRHAEEIAGLGREILEAARGGRPGKAVRLTVGVADAIPKVMAFDLLAPALQLAQKVRFHVVQDRLDRLVPELSVRRLDLVLSDQPVPPVLQVKTFTHALGESGVAVYGAPALVERHLAGFPRSLHGAPLLLPGGTTTLRRAVQGFLEGRGIRPDVVAEIEDPALLKVFGSNGVGLFPVHQALGDEARERYGVVELGVLEGVKERFYALSPERRVRHPAVLAIVEAARKRLGEERREG